MYCIVSSYMDGHGLYYLGSTLTGTLKREQVPAHVFVGCILLLEKWVCQNQEAEFFTCFGHVQIRNGFLSIKFFYDKFLRLQNQVLCLNLL